MSETQLLLSSEARVSTKAPRRYLGQLCKHFGHRLPVQLEEWQGRIEFPAGVCELDAAADERALVMRVSASEEAALARLEEVVGRHLERFAFREETKVTWKRAG